MIKKQILVVGFPQHTQTAHQINNLTELGVNVICLDPYGSGGRYGELEWQAGQVYWKGHNISPENTQAVLITAQASEHPYQSAFNEHATQALNWAEWFQCYGLQRDRSDTLLSLLLMYEQLGIPLFNPPSKSMISRRKPYQLSILQQVNCKLPATLVSNNPEAAEQFIDTHGACIIKPAAGGSLTLSANELMEANALENLREAPAIIQQRIYGDDLRIIVIDGQISSVAAVNVPADSIDFRGEPVYQTGAVTYTAATLPHEVHQQCIEATQALGLRFAGIDIKRTDNGDYYFLECNSSPIYLDVERKLGHPITQQLGEALVLGVK